MTYAVITPNSAVPTFRTLIQPDKLTTYFGGCWKGGQTPVNLPAYTATVQQDGATIATYNIPRHDYHSRWIHDLAPDTIIRAPGIMVAQDLIFPYGTPGSHQPDKPTNKYTGPMSPAGIYTAMATTGQRGDIGLLPEWDAYGMRTGDLSFCLEAAKGFDSMPIYRIDPATNRFVDMMAHPYASSDSRTNHPADFIPTAPEAGDSVPAGVLKGQWAMDMAHHPSVYIAYLATEKLRYLESLQAIAIFCLQTNGWYSETYGKNVPIIHCGQARGAFWTTRSLLMALMATKLAEQSGPVPEPLLPSSSFQAVLDVNIDYFTTGFMQDPALKDFGYFPDVTCYRPWQFAYGLDAFAFGVLTGAGQKWTDFYVWMMKNPVQRLNGTSGHPQALQIEYQYRLGPKGVMPDGANGFPREIKASQFFQGPQPWKQAWDNFVAEANAAFAGGATSFMNMSKAQIDALVKDPTGGGDYVNWDNYTPQTLRHVMAEADYLDKLGLAPITKTYPEFPACRDLITSMVLRWEAKSPNNKISSRVSAISTTGGIIMPNQVTISLGQKVHLDVTFTGPKPPTPPAYTQTDANIGALSNGDMAGVLFTSANPGKSTVTATATGVSGPITSTCEVTVTNPLPTAINLTPGTVS